MPRDFRACWWASKSKSSREGKGPTKDKRSSSGCSCRQLRGPQGPSPLPRSFPGARISVRVILYNLLAVPVSWQPRRRCIPSRFRCSRRTSRLTSCSWDRHILSFSSCKRRMHAEVNATASFMSLPESFAFLLRRLRSSLVTVTRVRGESKGQGRMSLVTSTATRFQLSFYPR
jgi:hypothetical protein